MTLGLNPTIKSLILHMYSIFEDSSLHSSRENSDTKLALKDRKMDKEREEYEQGVRFSIP